MDNSPKRNLAATKMVAQFYIDMSKYLLVLLFAFGLFHESAQSAFVRPILVIVAFASIVSAGMRAERSLNRINDEERRKDDQQGISSKERGSDEEK